MPAYSATDADAQGGDHSRDVVVSLSFETWDDIVRREFIRPPDRLLRYMASSGRVRRMTVANPWRNAPKALYRHATGRASAPFPATETANLVRPMRIRASDPLRVRSARRSYAVYDAVLRRSIRRHAMENPSLITFNPFHAAFGDHRAYRSVTYFGRDDWASHHQHERYWPVYRDAYAEISRRGIKVAAVSQEIIDVIAPTGTWRVVPNGVDADVWTVLPSGEDPFAGLPRPIALYTGTVDRRLEPDAVGSLTTVAGSVVLLGPQADETAAQLAARFDNVVLHPPVNQSGLAAAVARADVCVVPHVRNALTRAMSPLKVYEYVAAGKPVVATDLPPMRSIHPSLQLVAGTSFQDGFMAALELGPLSEEERLSFIDANSWSSRCESILDLALGD